MTRPSEFFFLIFQILVNKLFGLPTIIIETRQTRTTWTFIYRASITYLYECIILSETIDLLERRPFQIRIIIIILLTAVNESLTLFVI